jgi:AmmeMemoRadiSam system protein A
MIKSNDNQLTEEQQTELLGIARSAVETYVHTGKIYERTVSDDRLRRAEGAFVTLKCDQKLRGCIGTIVAGNEPLWRVVRDMAVEACSSDSRFKPVGIDELKGLEYEISVLSIPRLVLDWRRIELGKQGVIVRKGAHCGVFLPQVATETGWTLEEFLGHLCHEKAGLPQDSYKNDKEVILQVFDAQVFGEG